ncbi:glutathione binding-like protein [Bordetella hinzii]|uniref:glutathione binding-like protein n=1 Tax=Bordetella hinzii TaxID=103855 RepID=UPI00130D639A|nr:glutathione binding-like protein [Bordetella hinzii]MBZ0075871.1 glutathione S-transferase family protein [Bordetella hinzii]MBZ0080853.1 glutathione S-transferase family protein [Bordetella hinzii]MBZ0085258.1 glutathione S-transferase family protein [Bordetella hinzii]
MNDEDGDAAMILYSSPLACSCAAHMVLLELGLPHAVEFVDIYVQPHVLVGNGMSFSEVSPKDSVPALRLDSGELLTEIGVILQYIAGLRPDSGLLPEVGSMARLRVMEWLSYVGSEVHKTIGPLFHPHMPEAAKEIHRQNLHRRLSYIEKQLAQHAYLTGETFTVADAYLFVMIGWRPYFKFDITPYPGIMSFHERVVSRPSFAQVLRIIEPMLAKINLPAFPDAKSR